MMALILGFFFVGITFINYWYGIVPEKEVTVLSQIGKAVFGHGILYYVLQFATALILAVAANTGFSAFPVLAYNLAKDKFMPHMYQDRGDRLGYSNGIITLALGSIVLLFIFHGSTERLIPLYSIGVFIPFALSQTGMVVKWKKKEKMVKQIDCQYYRCVHLICNHCDFVCLSVRGHLAFLHHYANRYVHFYKIHDHYKK